MTLTDDEVAQILQNERNWLTGVPMPGTLIPDKLNGARPMSIRDDLSVNAALLLSQGAEQWGPPPGRLVTSTMNAVQNSLVTAEQTTRANDERACNAMLAFARDPSRDEFIALLTAWAVPQLSNERRFLYDFIVNVLRPQRLPRDGPFVWCAPHDQADQADPIDQEAKMTIKQILTPKGVSSFINLQKPRAIVEGADERYSLSIIFDKAAQQTPEFANLQKGMDAAIKERWPSKVPPGLISPFHEGASKAGLYQGYNAGDIFISPWTKNKPGCVNSRKEDIIDWGEFYAGWIVRANVRPFAYDTAGKRGVSFFLETVQFVKPGPRLDGRKPAAESFPDDDDDDGAAEEIV